MVRFVILYDVPADPAAFDAHYRDVHLPLAKKLPGLRKYTVSRGLVTLQGTPVHLVAELDFDDMGALQAAFGSPEGDAAAKDVQEFAGDRVHSMIFEVEDA
jgi:uncharacterized protein (TIGR02118 family)